MKITFEKTESIETMMQALSEFLLNENKDYPKLKSTASLYLNLEDINGSPHPNNSELYIYKDGKILSELDFLANNAINQALDSWNNYVRLMGHRHSLYKLVQELKIQEPKAHISSTQVNNKITSVYAYLQFKDSQNKSWWFYNNNLHNQCSQFESSFKKD